MDLVEAKEQKLRRTIISCHILVDTEEDLTDAVEEGEQFKDGNLGKPQDDLETRVLVTDDAADADSDDEEEVEGQYSVYGSRVAFWTRDARRDEVVWAVSQYKSSKYCCIMLHGVIAFFHGSGIMFILARTVVL